MLNLLDGWFKINLGDAAFYAVFGFLFVFVGIVLLILIFTLLGFIMKKVNARQKKERKPKRKEVVVADNTVSPVSEPTDGISPELVAVITAAVASCLEQENAQCDFVVRRIKKL